MRQVAYAIRHVTACMQRAIEEGQRARVIDAHDLIDLLLAIADEIDPQTADVVGPALACPECGESRVERLIWQEDDDDDDYETVLCDRCGKRYRPGN